MNKLIKVYDLDTGEVIEEVEFTGGYNISYTRNEDDGRIKHITRLDNAKFDYKHWIKNEVYRPLARKLIGKFEELKGINIDKILFIEDTEYQEPVGGPPSWAAQTKVSNKQLYAMTGYQFVIETREFYLSKMSDAQIAVLLYQELRKIDKNSGKILDYDIKGWNNILGTFGPGWDKEHVYIQNIVDDKEFQGWSELRNKQKQVSLFENDENRVVFMRAAK